MLQTMSQSHPADHKHQAAQHVTPHTLMALMSCSGKASSYDCQSMEGGSPAFWVAAWVGEHNSSTEQM